MAILNYTYLKLKMPGPNGVITVGPSYEHAYERDVECVEHGEAVLESAILAADLDGLANAIPDPKRHADSFKPMEDVKLVPLDPADPKGKALNVSATLDHKLEAATLSPVEPKNNAESSHGVHSVLLSLRV
jgi:hypothetical protein